MTDALRAFERTVKRAPAATAVVTEDGDTLSYADLDGRGDRLAAALDDRVGDDRVATLLDPGIPAIDVVVASLKRGVGFVPLSTRESLRHHGYVVDDAGPGAIVFDDANAAAAADLADRVGTAIHAGGGRVDVAAEDYDRALDGADGGTTRRGREFGVFYTSGSTGDPKGVAVDDGRVWHAATQAVMELGHRPSDVSVLVTPPFHLVTPASWIVPHFQVGGALLPVPAFEPGRVLDAIADHGATGLFAVPAQLDGLAAAQADDPRDLDSLRHVRTGGAPLEPGVVRRVHEHLRAALHNTYGLTEGVANLTHAHPDAQLDRPGTIGRASYAWEVRVVEDVAADGTPDPTATVDRGERGEIIGRGPAAVDGYLDDPEADAGLLVDARDGGRPWLRTGDVARVDAEGGLHVIDRIDNMIVSGGENVYPQEVERAIETHPAVEGVGVIGVPHPRWGTAVVAVVVGDVSGEALDAHCRERSDLADFKRPRAYRFTDELPRSAIGKLRRGEIHDRYGDPVERADQR